LKKSLSTDVMEPVFSKSGFMFSENLFEIMRIRMELFLINQIFDFWSYLKY